MTISGSGTATLGTWTGAAVATVDASGLTGAADLSATFTSSAAMTITGNAATTNFTGSMTVTGGSNGDTITGTATADTLNGGGGNDTLTGNGGADILNGNAGIDTINGGAGVDVITGGTGADIITSGAGADVLHFTTTGVSVTVGADVVKDFNHATTGDVIDLSSIGNTAKGAVIAQVAEGTTAAVAHATNTILMLAVSNYANYDTQAEVAATLAASNEFAAVVSGDTNTLIISAADTGHSYVWSLVESGANTTLADALDTVVQVAVLEGLDAAEAATLTAANFVA